MRDEHNILEVEALCVSYGGENMVEDVSFSVRQGQAVCIVGESGSGKSTLLKAILGLDEVLVTGGRVSYNGEKQPGTQIGLIPQNPGGSFNPIRSFKAQLAETFASHQLQASTDEILRVFESLGLADGEAILKSCPYEMSGGMNQRIAVAMAMLLHPRLLLCDEATSALDVTTAGMVVEQLLKIRDEGISILMVTHHLGIAKKLGDEIGIMQKGRMVECGAAAQILERPRHPYTQGLLRDVPRLAEMM